MANIGATTAFYKVETSLSRANNEVSKSMERLATGRANANAGDRSSFVAMADTFRLDFAGTKAGVKGASVVMGYLETGMRVLDAASSLLARIQELAVLGANGTNTTADKNAIDAEAEAIADEFHRMMTKSTYKGLNVIASTVGEYNVSVGGRSAAMTFGLAAVTYGALYSGSALYQKPSSGVAVIGALTVAVESAQANINAARVQAGSQYAALESALNYTMDLTAQYELGYNTVNDVNFSMETAHLAKNQILQQAATAMLAQANRGQQGLLQLIQQ
jgi:flagellin